MKTKHNRSEFINLRDRKINQLNSNDLEVIEIVVKNTHSLYLKEIRETYGVFVNKDEFNIPEAQERLIALRLYCELSLESAANLIGLSRQSYKNYELEAFEKGLTAGQITELISESKRLLAKDQSKSIKYANQWEFLIPLKGSSKKITALHPDLKKEWDFVKNNKSPEDYSPQSMFKAWFICTSGHSYQMPIRSFTGSVGPALGCPYCGGKNRTKPLPKKDNYLLKITSKLRSSLIPKGNKDDWNNSIDEFNKKPSLNRALLEMFKIIKLRGVGKNIGEHQQELREDLNSLNDRMKELIIAFDTIDEKILEKTIGSALYDVYIKDPTNKSHISTINSILELENTSLESFTDSRENRLEFLSSLLHFSSTPIISNDPVKKKVSDA